MKNIKFSKDDLIFLNQLLDSYKNIILYSPFFHYRAYKMVCNKIKLLKEKIGSV